MQTIGYNNGRHLYTTTSLLLILIVTEAGGNDQSEQCKNTNNQSELNSFLWTVQRQPPAYFFGTIHVPYSQVWDYIPENSKDAFTLADNIIFELDLTDHSTATALAQCQLLPDNETLENVLPKSLYRRLKRHMEYIKKKIPHWMGKEQRHQGFANYADYQYRAMAGSWNRMKPVWLMLTLNSLTENDVMSFGIPVLDLYLSRQALRLGKKVHAIELVEEQCSPLNALRTEQMIFALNQTLTQHEAYRWGSKSTPVNNELIHHYNCGDLNNMLLQRYTAKVPDLSVPYDEPKFSRLAAELDQYFQEELLYRRNTVMADRIVRLLRDHPTESFFFAFGAGHFLGNNTILDRVRSHGFTIEHTSPDTVLSNRMKKYPGEQQFTAMDTPEALISRHYLQAMAQLEQKGSGYSLRHRKNKERGHRRQQSEQQENNAKFSKLWIRIDHITEEGTGRDSHPGTLSTPSFASGASTARHIYLLLISGLLLKSIVVRSVTR